MNSPARNVIDKTQEPFRVLMLDLWATVPYYTAYLSRALLAEGVDVQVASMTYYLDPGCFESRGIKPDPGLLNLVGRYHLPRALRRVLKLAEGLLNLSALTVRSLFRRPDIVHIQYLSLLRSAFPVDFWFVSFCQWRGSKIVLTVHDLLPHDTAERYKEIFANLYRRVDSLICHSDHIKDRLQKEFNVPPQKIAVIPHGPFFYDLPATDTSTIERQLGVATGHRFALWQGIIFPYKGLDLLLSAWHRVEQQNANLDLVVLGTGSPELTTSLEQQARSLGLQRVRFNFRFASVEELAASYRAAQTVIYPYRAITTSGALATGLALGKPIIASDLPVFRELLTNEKDALLVNPCHDQDLADAIIRSASDPELLERLAAAVLQKDLGPKSWTSIAHKTEEVYVTLVLSRDQQMAHS